MAYAVARVTVALVHPCTIVVVGPVDLQLTNLHQALSLYMVTMVTAYAYPGSPVDSNPASLCDTLALPSVAEAAICSSASYAHYITKYRPKAAHQISRAIKSEL